MASTTTLRAEDHAWDSIDRPLKRGHEEVVTPTTPRPPTSQTFQSLSAEVGADAVAGPPGSTTLPSDHGSHPSTTFAYPGQNDRPRGTLYRGSSQTSMQSSMAVDDMDLDGSDDDQDGSDNDTENGEPGRSSKKKKGQRFFCTEFPPCNLSFTRSEHLARHIRKHTGERPFQCHCNRRFSRLDNLRQHAQTVHVNEEIPGDSLAATGTRFQRQIRTDRVRPAGSRPRSGTVGSSGSLSRGHSRNVSASSVGSNTSTYSNTPEPHRRPPPLIMANDGSGRPKLGLERPSTPPGQYRGYPTNSPGGFSTPASATYSGAPGSPGFGSTMDSPISTSSRGVGFFGPKTPNRRLSVPSGVSPFQNPHGGNNYPPSYPSPLTSSAQTYANPGSVYASPTSSTFSGMRMEPSAVPGDDWRRRTWHPSTYAAAAFNYSRPATSGLTYSQTPDAPQPAFAQYATAAAGQAPRLPGIESFDHVQHQPSTPPRRQPSPTRIDPALQAPVFATPSAPYRSHSHTSSHKRGRLSIDASLNTNLTRLDIHGNQPKEMTSWGQQTMSEIQNVAVRQVGPDLHGTSSQAATPMNAPRQAPQPGPEMRQPSTPPTSQRHTLYHAPPTAMRTSPEDSSSSEGVPTPGTSAAEIHPAIMHSNGFIEPHHAVLVADPCVPQPSNLPSDPPPQPATQRPTYYMEPRNGPNDMGRLEALVAVATSEDKATGISR